MTTAKKSRKADPRGAATRGSSRFLELLEPMMAAPGVARDAYRISLVGNFFNGPIYLVIQKQFGLLRDEINTLFCLAHFPELSQTDICLVMGRPKNSVSRAISRLLQRGLIAVRDDPDDGRKGVLSLRPEGYRLYQDTRRLFEEREAQMLASLTKADRATLDRLLTKIMASHEDWSELF
ncbi:MarR family winged helix-turn-helix transcriptional regulator [Frigidibacter sp.]|uniref:MarR family winged helix-turn-helix transcriptional regulator n=1 Tax=Frigidibacter sp. TaxID=2586418 RepID=UPI00273307B2|nr:MarR family transcriptional regulator [Frigidibacter sp.]MDP3342163.1 MarR family transcriptional regulator [Frigidibacter sp.]